MIDFLRFPTIVFVDTMVVLQGQPLEAQPWKEIDPVGPILILIVPQVQAEIDKRKLDGRLSKRARAFNKLIRPSVITGGSAIQISSGPPDVHLGMAFPKPIGWENLDDLDRSEADDVIIAQIMYVPGLSSRQATLISHDGNALAKASRHGIRVTALSDKWLLSPEPSPYEKEISRLKSQVEELQKSEPSISLVISIEVSEPLKVQKVEPLTEYEQRVLHDRLVEKNPQNYPPGGFLSMYASSGDLEYERYLKGALRRHAVQFHERVGAMFNQHEFRMRIENTGSIPAENLIVEIDAKNATVRDRFALYRLTGPPAPKARSLIEPLSFRNFEIPSTAGRHDMYSAIAADGGHHAEFHCEDFRQGRVWEFSGVMTAKASEAGTLSIVARVTAANLHGDIRKTAEVEVEHETKRIRDLVDLDKLEFLEEIPLRERVVEELEARNTDWFLFDEDDEDEDDEDD